MSNNTFSLVGGIIFAAITVLHFLRLIYSWEAVIGGLVLPLWISGLSVVLAGFLAFSAFRLWKRSFSSDLNRPVP